MISGQIYSPDPEELRGSEQVRDTTRSTRWERWVVGSGERKQTVSVPPGRERGPGVRETRETGVQAPARDLAASERSHADGPSRLGVHLLSLLDRVTRFSLLKS